MRSAPSMTGLRAFEAVLRHGTLTGAAAELCVTPAAISHRLRALEKASGQALVYREGGRFLATQTGLSIKAALADAFENIRKADRILSENRGRTLTVSVSYSFGVMWLIPHLFAFEQMHPHTSLYIQPSHDPLSAQGCDVVIVQLDGPPPRGQWAHIFDDVRAVMGRPAHPLLRSGTADPQAVLKADLLHIAFRRTGRWGEFTWSEWAEAQGMPPADPSISAEVTAEHMAVEMIQHRDSLALITVQTVADYIADGRLAEIPGSRVKTDYAYWASAVSQDTQNRELATHFLDWVQQSFAEDRIAWETSRSLA